MSYVIGGICAVVMVALTCMGVSASPISAPDLPVIIPWPQKLEMGKGTVAFPSKLSICVGGNNVSAARRVAETFSDDLGEIGFTAGISGSKKPEGGISLAIVKDKSLGKEGYRLSVGDSISINASTERGLFWGTRTAMQLLRKGPGIVIPRLEIDDQPRFEYRGCHVDVARKPHSIEFHRRMIKKLAQYKINYYHIHFVDDQSYTLPSDAFPNLPTPDIHYTKDQLRDLVKLASRYHIDIVPEIEMPGHASWLCEKIPEIICRNKKESWVVCLGSEKAYDVLESLISEVMEIFPGPYFHIGADEVPFNSWDGCPDCAAMIEKNGLKNNEALYNYFINRMNRFVKSKGRRTIVWEGFKASTEPKVDKDVIVDQFENLFEMPQALADAGYDLINASWSPLYVATNRATSVEGIAEWNHLYFGKNCPPKPLSEMIKIKPSKHLIGICLCSWENIESVQEAVIFGTGQSAQGYAEPSPRLLAVAERAWSGDSTTPEDLMARIRN